MKRNVALGVGAVGLAALAAVLYAKGPKLSRATREALKANATVSGLDVLSTNKKKDIITAKFRAADEYISLSTVRGRDIEVRAEGYRNDYIITFRVDKSLTRTTPATAAETRAILTRVREMITEQVPQLPRGAQLYAEPVSADGSNRARRAIYKRWGFKDAGDGIGLRMPASEWRATRTDAAPSRQGKPCGASHIPKAYKCSKKTVSPTRNALGTAAKIALAAGVIAGGAAIAKKAMSMAEWRNHPDNPRNTPRLSPEENQRIIDETLAAGQKWDVQERINARRLADLQAECGGGLGKISAPAKFDAAVSNPRCQAGAGAFGTYFVHTSEKYGIKLFRGEDEDADPGWEFDRLGKAHAAGVNVPEPLAINYTKDGTHTLTLRHMKGYREMGDVYSTGGFGLPRIVQLKVAREYRKLHTEGLAHGDIHGGNIMVNPTSKRVALVDFGFSTEIYDAPHRIHNRDGVANLMGDLGRLPEYLGLSSFTSDYRGVLSNIKKQALDYDRSWDKYELAIKRYYDVLEAELLDGERRSRSRFVSGADQPRIPGITRAVLTANANTFQRQVMEQVGPTLFVRGAKNLGLKPAQLYRALAPERAARKVALRQRPFGTPIT